MIQPLRTVHGRAFLVLAGLLPAILAVGLGERHKMASAMAVPLAVPQDVARLETVSAKWEKNRFATKFYTDAARQNEVRLLANVSQEPQEPDLLLYWADGVTSDGDGLSHARLLGSFVDGRTYPLPQGQQGFLLLYSLGHRAIVDRAKVEGLP